MTTGETIVLSGIFALIITLILSVTWGIQSTNEKITRMVEAGANPQSATCALTEFERNCWIANRSTK